MRGERRVEEVVERRRNRARDRRQGSGRRGEGGRRKERREEASASMVSRRFAVDRGRCDQDPPPRYRAFRYARYVFFLSLPSPPTNSPRQFPLLPTTMERELIIAREVSIRR